MRFGRRHKQRPPVSQNMALAPTEDAIESDERSALLDNTASTDASQSEPEHRNQALLQSLRQFHQHLRLGKDTWTDDAMDQLVVGLELALAERWQPVAQALTDTGRILQSYENARQAESALPALERSYQMLCLMATDLLIGDVSTGMQEKWRKHYQETTRAIRAAGIQLAHDDNDGERDTGGAAAMNSNANRHLFNDDFAPFKEPLDIEQPGSAANDELPSLDELPPLESMLEIGIEPGSSGMEIATTHRTTVPPKKEAADSIGRHGGNLASWMQREKGAAAHSFGNVTFLEEDAAALKRSDDDGQTNPQPSKPKGKSPTARAESPKDESPKQGAPKHETTEQDTPRQAIPTQQPDKQESPKQVSPKQESPKQALSKPAAAPAPPKIVVEILDRICDQLNLLHQSAGEDRGLALERIEGAVSVLKREAGKARHAGAVVLCETMGELCVLASITDGPLNERFMDVAYAFGGAYMEAINGDESRVVNNWQIECDLLIEAWDAEDGAEEEDIDVPCGVVTEAAEEVIDDSALELASVLADETAAPVANELPPHVIFETPVEAAAVEAAPAADDQDVLLNIIELKRRELPAPKPAPSEELQSPDLEEEGQLSARLLESAQRAAAQGDGTGAKFFALRAAASIAKDETVRAERVLKDTELRLKQSMEWTEKAREHVKSAEDGVMKAATEVAERESLLGSAQVQRGRVAQQLEELQCGVAEIEEQIRLLQSRRETELKKAEAAAHKLEETQRVEREAETRLADQRKSEAEARLSLESCRQEVKNQQRLTLEIESEVEKARERLTQQRTSLGDIEQTIEQICGNEKRSVDADGALLF